MINRGTIAKGKDVKTSNNIQENGKMEKRKGGTDMKIWKEPERYFPPGYEYRKEWYAAGLLYVLGVALNLRFLGRLW